MYGTKTCQSLEWMIEIWNLQTSLNRNKDKEEKNELLNGKNSAPLIDCLIDWFPIILMS
jgi:hypothetical protein